jgi:arsenate reductase-like glutaredoxin family protein
MIQIFGTLKSFDVKTAQRWFQERRIPFQFVDLKYHYNAPFERIRRITGYLVGTTDRWNNAKKAELKDRVKHNLL